MYHGIEWLCEFDERMESITLFSLAICSSEGYTIWQLMLEKLFKMVVFDNIYVYTKVCAHHSREETEHRRSLWPKQNVTTLMLITW